MDKFVVIIALSLFFFTACQSGSNVDKVPNGITLKLNKGTLGIYPLSGNTVRVQYFKGEKISIPEFVLLSGYVTPGFDVFETAGTVRLSMKGLVVEVDKTSGNLTFIDSMGTVILKEKAGTRLLKPDTVMDKPCFMVEQTFYSPVDESVFGLGQFQDGHYNLKGVSRRLTQVNSQIAIPFMYSNKGYGLLWHQYGLTDFNPADNFITLVKHQNYDDSEKLVEVTTTAGTQKVAQNQSFYTGKFSVPADGEYSIFLDLGGMGNRHYVVIDSEPCIDQSNMWLPPTAGTLLNLTAGEHIVQLVCKADNNPQLSWKLNENTTTFRSPHAQMLDYVVFAGSADEVIASYRNLSGNAPLFPKWAYGFWQCRERYTSANHLVETVKEFRQRQLPVDVIVQDWQYWGNRGWGVPQFDETNYPNPSEFINKIHDLNAHFNISIWSNPDKNSEIGKQYVDNFRFIGQTKWLDYFNPETRREYWNTLKVNMFDNGVDSWWMDAVEPENDALTGTRTHIGPGDFYRLTYPLMVSKAVYDGQRAATNDKRVCILTRSAFAGQQRYGVINWSGDIGGDWDTYRRQIVAGLNFTISGLPYWTTDIGGFFRPGPAQYTNQNYHELLLRWFQWGAFNPIFRIHGYMSETEPWKYGQKVENNMRKMLNLRYQLLPYIYSQAWQITSNGSTIMRPLVFDFANDAEAVKQAYEFMFGKAFLVAPITEAGTTQRPVYLPKAAQWYNFWTDERFAGGQTITADAPIDQIPVFVKAGSIIPVGPVVQYVNQNTNETLELRIYEGANGNFTLYEDEGDNYNYENGKFSTIAFVWNDESKTLTIDDRAGNFEGMLESRQFDVKIIGQNSIEKTVDYTGNKETLQF